MNAKPAPLNLQLPHGAVTVRLIRRARQSVGIRIKHGEVELIAPPAVPLAYLQEVLASKRDWIARHLARHHAEQDERALTQGQVLLGGESYRLHCVAASRHQAQLVGDTLHLAGPMLEQPARLAASVVGYEVGIRRQRFAARLELWQPRAARPLPPLRLSSARTRWGSCTGRGVVRLNWRLVQAPESVLDYVIAHELAHLLHMNHSPAFWAEVARLYPGWQGARQWLKQHGDSLFRYG